VKLTRKTLGMYALRTTDTNLCLMAQASSGSGACASISTFGLLFRSSSRAPLTGLDLRLLLGVGSRNCQLVASIKLSGLLGSKVFLLCFCFLVGWPSVSSGINTALLFCRWCGGVSPGRQGARPRPGQSDHCVSILGQSSREGEVEERGVGSIGKGKSVGFEAIVVLCICYA